MGCWSAAIEMKAALQVARMIMMGIEFTGKVPFSTVFLHGLVGVIWVHRECLNAHRPTHHLRHSLSSVGQCPLCCTKHS